MFIKEIASLQRKSRVYKGNREFTKEIASLQRKSRVYKGNREFTKEIASLQRKSRVYKGNREFTKEIVSLQRKSRVAQERVDSADLPSDRQFAVHQATLLSSPKNDFSGSSRRFSESRKQPT